MDNLTPSELSLMATIIQCRLTNRTVLYRALTDVYLWASALSINRLGIVANWEWGNDTGSGFSNFIGRTSD